MRRGLAAILVALMLAVAGCGSASEQLLRAGSRPGSPPPARTRTTTPAPSAESVYLAQLGAEQTELTNAERRIPTNPRTPAALVHSVDLLTAAVQRLADGLAAIKPPASVAADHAKLVAIMRTYAARLDHTARVAVTPGGEQRAGALLLNATNQASTSFTLTITAIDSTLGSAAS
jgi:hypothetical protein